MGSDRDTIARERELETGEVATVRPDIDRENGGRARYSEAQ